MYLWMAFLTGVLYPLSITLIAQLTMKQKADGNFVYSKGKIVGSSLIGQKFEGEAYFWPRPSSIDYNPLPSGGSNLGPTSAALKKVVDERQEKISKAHHVEKKDVPAELLFASGSGLDPHIRVNTAYFQIDRIAKSRGMPKEKIKDVVDKMTIHRHFHLLGTACVNVLDLNRALDEL